MARRPSCDRAVDLGCALRRDCAALRQRASLFLRFYFADRLMQARSTCRAYTWPRGMTRVRQITFNCPFTKEEYERFIDALISAEAVESKEWEKLNYFEGCLPIEEIARRGRETLRFGPMKPVGLKDPRTGVRRTQWCSYGRKPTRGLLQHRGFQNHMKFETRRGYCG